MIHGGEYNGQINMDFSVNLNPLGMPSKVMEGIKRGLERIGEYPEYSKQELLKSLAKLEDLMPENILPGNGASELIMAIVRAVNPKKAVLVEPCFFGYRHALNALNNCSICEFILDEKRNYVLDEKLLEAMDEDTDIIFLTNPWNPLGYNLDSTLLCKLLDRATEINCAVVLDESFLLLSEEGNKTDNKRGDYIKTYPNLFITRSFTKLMAMPGIRIGYMMSNSNNVNKVRSQLCEWNVSQIADYAGRACGELLKDSDYVEQTNALIKIERDYLTNALKERGITVFGSDTVFILIKSDMNLYRAFLDKNILIRDCSEFMGLGEGYYRIAVKDHESNRKLIEVLDEFRNC